MESGNPKQLAVLAVMAVGAVGFLLTRLGGKASPLAVLAVATGQKESAPQKVATLALSRDPFSHPRLAALTKKPGVESPAPEGPAAPMPGGLLGALPPVGPLLPQTPATLATAAVGKAKPIRPAPAKTAIVLEAVLGASDAVAFLRVDGAESQPFHPNDRIKGAIRLLRVEDGAVVVSDPKGRRTLGVGERIDL